MPLQKLLFASLMLIMLQACNAGYNQSINRSDQNNDDSVFSSHGSAAAPENAKPGACYAKCLHGDKFETVSHDYYIYTGDVTTENVALETIKLEIKPAQEKWVKKRTDKNCLSNNPEDCKVWCLVNIPAETVEFMAVKDTSQTDNYRVESITQYSLYQKGGFTDWREVLCSNQVTPQFISALRVALSEKGYAAIGISDQLTQDDKKALTQFQKDHNLPIGQLDLETISALQLTY
ncbi:MAG: hypothetical protein AAFO94_08865 [Bacteroidota bacterium]